MEKLSGEIEKYKEFNDLIFHKKISEVLNGKKIQGVVSIDGETNIVDTLEILKMNRVFSASIFVPPESNPYNATKEFSKDLVGNYRGMIGTYEIVSFMLGFFFQDQAVISSSILPGTDKKIVVDAWTNPKPKEIKKRYGYFKETPIVDIIRLSPHLKENTELQCYCYTTDTISMALRQFSESHLTRLPVVDYDKIVGVLSRSDILKQLISKELVDKLPLGVFNSPLSALEGQLQINRDFWTIDESELASYAFQLMEEHKQQSIAIIRGKHQLVSNFSLSDLRGITISNIEDLNLPLKEYLATLDKPPGQIISITMQTTLLETIQLIIDSNIHGLWITTTDNTDSSNIIGYLSVKHLTDLIYHFIKLI
ncbi:hypothetical protein DLAC_11618 [Tieghemostelium lacteum]|uniref:CBS domain-containing protein n=1 Tax=Tieghemostelium lacteum TaxID=361077 RepID=A0A151ZIY7_TIELA|nr:hypothetical protein DLAC_11618 [Tieghemostelium lacteum]|eukprot:KYQ93850.1 hypothetical protein DLAC_11618 [Tieghemostelium lacteum]